jgi:hypothetical protein
MIIHKAVATKALPAQVDNMIIKSRRWERAVAAQTDTALEHDTQTSDAKCCALSQTTQLQEISINSVLQQHTLCRNCRHAIARAAASAGQCLAM